jgi:hypothetical protein
MAGKDTAVFGIYRNRSSMDRAVEALKAGGFSNNDVSALFPENQRTKDFAHEKNTKAPEGATTGAGTGALLGGGLGWLVGIGALAIPGLGPFIAAGPIVAALAGAGITPDTYSIAPRIIRHYPDKKAGPERWRRKTGPASPSKLTAQYTPVSPICNVCGATRPYGIRCIVFHQGSRYLNDRNSQLPRAIMG